MVITVVAIRLEVQNAVLGVILEGFVGSGRANAIAAEI
jgi:hypothetical protein